MRIFKVFLKYFILIAVISVSLLGVLPAKKVNANADVAGLAMAIQTRDGGGIMATLAQTVKDVANWARDHAYELFKWARDEGIALAYKKAISYFLKKLAYDTATYLATGEKGQGSMFYTESWGDYLSNVADNAAGHFLEELGKHGPNGSTFNLCDPGLDVTMRIGLGLMKDQNPDAPDCTFTEMKKNWQSELQRKDFLNRFSNMFEPTSNDFGIALTLRAQMMKKKMMEKEASTLQRNINGGFKDVTDKVSKTIKTPGNIVRSYTDNTIAKSNNQYFTYTGHALADAIDVFTNTLLSKLMQEWLKKGLARSYDDTAYTGNWGGFSSGAGSTYTGFAGVGNSGGGATYGSSGFARQTPIYQGGGGLTAYESDNRVGHGISNARQQFQTIMKPSFSVRGDYKVLSQLAICSNPTKAKDNECVLTENFRQAVENRMTVAEAMNEGYINKDGIFGFQADGLEPNFNEAFPYRSMIILRKYRILPVGWELAAQYIMQHQTTLHRSFSLNDMISCFDNNDRYIGFQDDWCEGLVDPSWVLKSPQNFCKREGPGPNIISTTVTGEKEKSKLSIVRDTSYCADDQTCIKEKNDGSCEIYGYCTEDRRKYNFDGEACKPIYNTCQSFRAEDGRTIALLQNTLDYGGATNACTVDNVGCRLYKQAINPADGHDGSWYDDDTEKVDWSNVSSDIKLDNDAGVCDAKDEGCHEFIRTKPGLGANLLPNPSFEENDAQSTITNWNFFNANVVQDAQDGYFAVHLSTDFNYSLTIDPYDISGSSNFDLQNNIFTLSLYVHNCNDGAEITMGGTDTVSLSATDWHLVVLTHTFDNLSGQTITIQTTGIQDCTIDAIKLERTTPDANGTPTRFSLYREAGLVYEKLIPAYLYATCYDYSSNGFISPLNNAPEICNDYVRYCTASEVDCNMYESMNSDFSVPAVAVADDYCPAECVGYDEYIQAQTNFEDQKIVNFIPSTAKACGAISAGCDEFTNLDEVDDPENREYFIHMRQCINPDDVQASCQAFFMWEGTDETGYQLRVHQLNAPGGNIQTVGIAPNCSTDITAVNYDPDCRDYYDVNGRIQSEIFYNTVSCTADCHPYRRTVMEDDLLIEQSDCSSHHGTWDNAGYCIYMGVPGEGLTCDAEEAGCRMYNGNTGANTRVVFEHSFENGTNQAWNNGANSSASVIMGEHSLVVSDNTANLVLGSSLQEHHSYVLQFLAVNGTINSIYFINSNGDREDFLQASIIPGVSWQSFTVNLDSLNHAIDNTETLNIEVAGTIYLDNIRLIEVVDRYYLLKNSWQDNCQYENADPDVGVVVGDGYYAGCDAYQDQDEIVHNLYKFDHLCSESAVGCELMIDTHNQTNYQSTIWHDENSNGVCDAGEDDCVLVPADSYIYAVYNNKKTCEQANKGCERLGLEYSYEYPSNQPGQLNYYQYQYFDNYKLNNPDIYDKSLASCQTDTVGCDAWETKKAISYFKDPADMVCEWRVEDEHGIGAWQWLKKEVKRCDDDDNGQIDVPSVNNIVAPIERQLCSAPEDCNLSGSNRCENDDECNHEAVCVNNKCYHNCLLDTHDYICEVDNTSDAQGNVIPPKTMGYGGPGNKIEQPLGDLENSGWTALCPAGESGCTEYIDPQSTFSFTVDTLKPYTLYTTDTIVPSCANSNFYVLNNGTNSLINQQPVPGDVFYYYSDDPNNRCRFDADTYHIKQTVVDYQLENSLDKTTCNGVVDLDKGCLLFNERAREGVVGMSTLNYDASHNYNVPQSPISANPGNSNVLLKVSPDRTCNSWLSCRSFIKDNKGNDVCYDVGACQRLDDNGNCSYFVAINTNAHNQIYPSNNLNIDAISNMTGYTRVSYGSYDNAYNLMTDYFSLGDMRQVGQVAEVPNGGFELYDNRQYPIGWTPGNNNGNANWERDMFKVINNPVSAQTEGIHYPQDGRSFLKFGARDTVQSEWIELAPDTDYTLTFAINTKNLASNQAIFTLTGNIVSGSISDNILATYDWQTRMIQFHSGNGDQVKARIILSSDQSDGNVYVDNIQIKPALHSRNIDNDNEWRTPQTCRLYPKSDSLSCDYYDDSGHRKKGWPGYCLEYDRYPGDPNTCLLWYPIDRVNGDGIEDGGGYIDRKPLYYCVDTENYHYGVSLVPGNEEGPTETETLVTDNNFGAQSSGDMSITHRNSDGFSFDDWTLDQLGLGSVDEKWLLWDNIDHIRIHEMSPSTYCGDKYEPSWDYYFNFDQNNLGNDCLGRDPSRDCQPWGVTCTDTSAGCDEGGLRIISTTTDEGESFGGLHTTNWDGECNHPDYQILEVVIFPKVFYCSDVIQSVTPMGQNKYWSSHVYEGSNYGDGGQVPCNHNISFAETHFCTYMTDLAPFGAVSQPGMATNDWAVMSNPYMWDSREGIENNQPLFFEIPNGSMFNDSEARMGQKMNSEDEVLDELFGEHYGHWHFYSDSNNGVAQVMGHYNLTGEGSRFKSAGRDPLINNVSITPNVGDRYVNQLLNLKFYTDVDPDHLPMTMYKIDWGDNTVTSVSGVEMRDRPMPNDPNDIGNPHSMYHIYSEACPGSNCHTNGYTITITIRDNWGRSTSFDYGPITVNDR